LFIFNIYFGLARARSAGYVKEKPTSKCSLKLVAPTIFRTHEEILRIAKSG